jgi:hypothetical protein
MTRKTIQTILIPALLNLCILQLSHAGVYKWTDENGLVHYAEEPGSIDAEKIPIRQNETTTPRTVNEAAVEIVEKSKAKSTEKTESVPEEPAIPKKEKQRLCQEGKNDYATISSRGRMREIDEKGEYVYLNEEQRQQRLAAAKEKQRKYCH